MTMSVYNFDYDNRNRGAKAGASQGEMLARMPYKSFRDGFNHPPEERSLKIGSVAVWTVLATGVVSALVIGNPLPFWS